MTAPILDYRQEQETLRATLRGGMLAAANRLLTQEGPSALTVRRVAEAVNCSTTLLYSVFGGKDGLSNALYLEGFARLKKTFDIFEAKLTPAQKTGSLQRIWLFSEHYHRYARENPSYYQVMFGDAIAGFVPPQESRAAAWASFKTLVDRFEECMQTGVLPTASPNAAARLLWASMHGVISLELKGYYLKEGHADQLFHAAVRAVLFSLQHPESDHELSVL